MTYETMYKALVLTCCKSRDKFDKYYEDTKNPGWKIARDTLQNVIDTAFMMETQKQKEESDKHDGTT